MCINQITTKKSKQIITDCQSVIFFGHCGAKDEKKRM